MSELPQGWLQTTLALVTAPRGEKANPADIPAKLFIGLEEVEAHTGRISANQSVAGLKSAVALFQKGDLLYGRLRPYLNKVAIANIDGAASAEFIVFPSSKAIDQRYLQCILMSPDFVAFTGLRSTGDRPRVSFEVISDYEVPLPPLPEQRRIVAKIDSLSAKSARARDRLDHIPRLVETYKQAVLAAAFRGDLTREWRHKQVAAKPWRSVLTGDLISWSSGKNLPTKKQSGGTIPVIGGNGIGGYHDQALIAHDTVVIGRVGAQCGNVHLSTGPAWITDNAIYARAISDELNPSYAVVVLRTKDLNRLAGGTGQPYVNQTILNAVEFELPPLPEQQEILRLINAACTWIDRLATEATSARKLVDHLDQAVLSKAFRGELVPQDPGDEPAVALLERIKAEREGSPVVTPRRGRRAAG